MKKLIIIVATLFISMFSISVNADCFSSGVRKGYIQKFSKKGVMTKSWEGEMVQDGIRTKGTGDTRGLTNIWKFSVTNPAVASKIDDAVFDGGQVAVKYCQSMIRNPFASDTSYEVTDVKILGK